MLTVAFESNNVSTFFPGGCVCHHVGSAAADHPVAVHEHAVEALERKRGNSRTRSGPRHPQQVQGQGEQDESDENDHRGHHRFRHLLDSSAGLNIVLFIFVSSKQKNVISLAKPTEIETFFEK